VQLTFAAGDRTGAVGAFGALWDAAGRPAEGPVLTRPARGGGPGTRAMSRESLGERLRTLRTRADGPPGEPGASETARLVAAALAPTPMQLRDRAALLCGFYTAGRRSNLVALDWRHLRLHPGEGIEVLFARSKTDQEGRGFELWLPYGSSPLTCPVTALLAWAACVAETTGVDPLSAEGADMAVLVRCNGRGGLQLADGRPVRLGGDGYAEIVKRFAVLVGEDPARFAGHSLRAGLTTTGADAGLDIDEIQGITGHRRVETVLRYVRRSERRRRNLAVELGL
jgi:integrase